MNVVFDASAVLALTLGEPGADRVAARLGDAAVSAVNAAEVFARLSDLGLDAASAASDLAAHDVCIVAFDEAQARLAGILRASTRHLGLSLGDRSCLALAMSRRATVLTADRAWAALDIGVKIEVIR